MASQKLSPSFTHFLPELFDALQRTADAYLDSYDEHKAFVYMIAEQYETTHPDRFVFSDGPHDGGIDFFVADSPSYTIAQCKCPNLISLQTEGSVPKYDQSALDQLVRAVNMLLDRNGDYDVQNQVRRLRGDFQRDLNADVESTTLVAILAVFGELTPAAKAAFNSVRQSFSAKNVHFKLVQWEDIYRTLHALETPEDVDFDIEIHFDDESNLLSHLDYCYVLAQAVDFYQAFRDHEWNLFDWNVRYQIHNSPINKRIVNTLSRIKGQRQFHHYNNGLLITCKNYTIDRNRKRLKLVGPQIINGCQTVRAICEAYESLSPDKQEHFREKTRVQVKIIKTTDLEFIGDLVISTNDQNPMNSRNLKSNTAEQRDIQKGFRGLPVKWFYQRKDGEFRSLTTSGNRVRWFKKSDYAATSRHFRLIDNEKLAKTWYAFIGYSNRALRGGINFFDDEVDGVYSIVFKSVPSTTFWVNFAESTFVPEEKYLESGLPSVYQYLLAYGVAQYIDSRRISYRNNRLSAIQRGIDGGDLKGSLQELAAGSMSIVDIYLSTDIEYYLNRMLNNMREVLIELFSFVLTLKYGACDASVCQKLLNILPHEAKYAELGFDNGSLPPSYQDGSTVFGPIYEFIQDCVKQYLFEFKAEIDAAPRLKSYLAQRTTINRLRSTLARRNSAIKEYDQAWKKGGYTFIESLPPLI